MIETQPTVCNCCGGRVVWTIRSGLPKYVCTYCGASVNVNPNKPNSAVGTLADTQSRYLRKQCHELFDLLWKGKKNEKAARTRAYTWLAKQMGKDRNDCHFSYFTKAELHKAYDLLVAKTKSAK